MKPFINDITTDPESSPGFQMVSSSKSGSYPKELWKIQNSLYPNVRPLDLDRPVEEVYEVLLHFIHRKSIQERWTLVGSSKNPFHLEAKVKTRWFRFVDDIAIDIHPLKQDSGKGRGCRIQMRSRSRLGRSDFGMNAARIKKFFKEFSQIFL